MSRMTQGRKLCLCCVQSPLVPFAALAEPSQHVLDPLHPFVQFVNVLGQFADPIVQLVVSAFVLLFGVVALDLLGVTQQVLGLFV